MSVSGTSLENPPRTYRTRYDTAKEDSVCITICQTISAIENVDVEDLDLILYDYFDVDTLETLTANTSSATDWEFTVSIEQYQITIRNDGSIIIEVTE